MRFTFVCPSCRGPLEELAPGRLRCSADRADFELKGGIWRFLDPERASEVDRFLSAYRRIRRDEGWGSEEAAYYRELPFRDLTNRHPEIWRIRAESYRLLCRCLLADGRRQRIVDLGAGNCWLSHRLAAAGHTVAAVDLSDDRLDGLGAADAFSERVDFRRLQAGFDAVPLRDGEADLAVFNGSLHYSAKYSRTLAEARRLVRSGGRLVILDTPVYARAASGRRMVRERWGEWRERYGESFGGEPGGGFLTRRRLRRLGNAVGLRWQIHPLRLGWRWHLGPLLAVLRGRREPARFPLIIGRSVEPG